MKLVSPYGDDTELFLLYCAMAGEFCCEKKWRLNGKGRICTLLSAPKLLSIFYATSDILFESAYEVDCEL